jgi:MarR family transcriptional regulator, organic hydroperoxide resistance regulator
MNRSVSVQQRSRSKKSRSRSTIAAGADRFDDSFQSLAARIPSLPPPDLTRDDLAALFHVADGEGATLGWLAEHLDLPKSSTSVLVKHLERRRFVRRRRRADDERRLEVRLTPKGRRRVLAARALDADALARALGSLPRRDRIALIAGMERLAAAVRANDRGARDRTPTDA